MEFIELADYPLPAGRVVEWLPTAQAHWVDWPRDHRAVSDNHRNHLREVLEHRRLRETRQHWLGQAFSLDRPIDARAWAAAVNRWIDRHEVLRTHVTVEGGRPARHTAPVGCVRVSGREAGNPLSTISTYRHVQRVLDEATSPLHWPSYLFVTVAHTTSCTVVFGADHSIIDGYSMVMVAGELRALYEGELANTGVRTTGTEPEVGSYLDFSDQESARAEAITVDDPAVQVWREFFAGTRTGAGAPPTSPATRPMPQRALSVWLTDEQQTDSVAATSHAQGHGLFAALLAATASAFAELTGRDEFCTVVPQHTRSEQKWAQSLGWFVGLAPFRIRTEGAASLLELIGPVGQELRRGRVGATVPFSRICALAEEQPTLSFVVSYMDIRQLPGADNWPKWNTRCLFSRNTSPEEFYIWFGRTGQGVTVNMRYPGTAQATREVHRFVVRLRALLSECAEHGDARIDSSDKAEPAWK